MEELLDQKHCDIHMRPTIPFGLPHSRDRAPLVYLVPIDCRKILNGSSSPVAKGSRQNPPKYDATDYTPSKQARPDILRPHRLCVGQPGALRDWVDGTSTWISMIDPIYIYMSRLRCPRIHLSWRSHPPSTRKSTRCTLLPRRHSSALSNICN